MRCRLRLACRLTLWYAGVFGFCFLAVFGSFYFLLHQQLNRWTDTRLKEELTETDMAFRDSRAAGVIQQLNRENTAEGERFMGRLIDPEGKVIHETAPGKWARTRVDNELAARVRSGTREIEKLVLDGERAAVVLYSGLPDGSVVQLGLMLSENEAWLRRLSKYLLLITLPALVLAVLAGGFMARRALSPIREMAHAASCICSLSDGHRMPVSGRRDELNQLAESFNEMLDRIDTLVKGMREVTDSFAHDLRTPIAGIRGMAEVMLNEPRRASDYREALIQIMESSDQLLNFASTILEVAQAESGVLALKVETLGIDELAGEVAQTFMPVALERGIALDVSTVSGAKVEGDRARLSQVIANLIDNALKHTPGGGRVGIRTETCPEKGGTFVIVSDTGSGIPEKDLPHIFERYYRGKRSQGSTGIGLGLTLVQGIVKRHGGAITVESSPGRGTVFRAFLPSGNVSSRDGTHVDARSAVSRKQTANIY
ncbi:MAG: ATP-binding protein [Syntrophobacter sp.]